MRGVKNTNSFVVVNGKGQVEVMGRAMKCKWILRWRWHAKDRGGQKNSGGGDGNTGRRKKYYAHKRMVLTWGRGL